MVDTVRPLATIQNLLADNVAGNISAQDLRDAIISLWVNTVPLWTDVAHVSGQAVRRPDGNVYQANDAIPLGSGFNIGTTGPTWSLVLDGSGKINGIASGTLITVETDGTPTASSMQELGDRMRSTKQIEAPGGGGFILSNWDISTQGSAVGFLELASNIMYLPIASRLETDGASRPFFEAFGPVITTPSPTTATTEFAAAASIHQFEIINPNRGIANSYTVQRPPGATDATECNFTVRLNSFTDEPPLIDYKRDHPQGATFTLGPGQTTITLPSPGFFIENTRLYITVESEAGDNLRLLGQTIDIDPSGVTDNQDVPYLDTVGRVSVNTTLAYASEIRSDEQIQDLVAAMFTGGTQNGITVTYRDNDENDGVIDLTVTGGVPQPGPSVSDFTINIPSTVNVGTDLNNQRTIAFDTVQTAQIASLDLVITTGTDQNITPLPTTDGSHSRQVTLAGIDTTAAGTVVFQIRGTTTGGQTIMSNSVTINIRAVSADEQAYYGTRATNDFATVNTNLLTAVDVQPPGSQYTISGSWPNGHTIGILEPTDRPITSIVETAFNQETLSTWTRTAAARTINGQSYDLLTQVNNGPTGTFDFRVTHG